MAEKPDPVDQNLDQADENPEAVQQVATETEQVFKKFVYSRLTSRIDKESDEGDLTVADVPSNVMNELRNAHDDNDCDDNTDQKQINELAFKLANFGDEIQAKYHDTFQEMMSNLNLSNDEDFAFDSFAKIARKLFNNGVTWSRIIALMCFGYEIALHVIKKGVNGTIRFLNKIVRFVVDFIVKEKIANWIATHGGWFSAIVGITKQDSVTWTTRVGAAAVFVAFAYIVYRLTRNDS